MATPAKARRWTWWLAVAMLVLPACGGPTSILESRGPGARRVEGLWWLMLWISVAVVVIVVVLLAYSVMGRRSQPADSERPAPVPAWGNRFVILTGFVGTTVILIVVFLISLRDLTALTGTEGAGLQVEVVGNMWWWEARYPGGAVTANEIHIPVGEAVEIVLTTDDVIHSFWVPNLHPKRDMIPGDENRIVLQADEPGRYRGFCAEFCGLQHANMQLFVVADPDFDRWLADQRQPSEEPTGRAAEGLDVFLSSTCVGCHTIRGTPAAAQEGPDLTHLARRETLFAGILENTRENLAAIVTDPQSIKPGVAMPPTTLTDAELDALLDYLESLG